MSFYSEASTISSISSESLHRKQFVMPQSSTSSTTASSSSSRAPRGQRQRPPYQYRGRRCSNCGDTETHQWRKGEAGADLCNPCGIKWKRQKVQNGEKKVRKYVKKAGSTRRVTSTRTPLRRRPPSWDMFSQVSDEGSTASRNPRQRRPVSFSPFRAPPTRVLNNNNGYGHQRPAPPPPPPPPLPSHAWKTQSNMSYMNTQDFRMQDKRIVYPPPVNNANQRRRPLVDDMPGIFGAFLNNPKRKHLF